MRAIESMLSAAGYETFLPQRDGLENVFMPLLHSPLNIAAFGLNKLADRSVFRYDLHQLVYRCDALVMNMNGRVPDEGACVEAGIAFALGKPVVLYKNDVRTAFDGLDNAMISGLSLLPAVNDLAALPNAVEKTIEECKKINLEWQLNTTTLPPVVIDEANKGENAAKWLKNFIG